MDRKFSLPESSRASQPRGDSQGSQPDSGPPELKKPLALFQASKLSSFAASVISELTPSGGNDIRGPALCDSALMGTRGSHMGALTRWGHPPEDVWMQP